MKKLPKIDLKKIKFRKIFTLLAAVLTIVQICIFVLPIIKVWQARAAATIYWDGGGNGTSWSDALNWNTDVVPSASDEVLIDTNATVNITESITITSLTLGRSDASVTPVLQFSYDAITFGPLTITGSELRVYTKATIRHITNTSQTLAKININVPNGDAIIAGDIDVNARGFEPGEGDGAGQDGEGSGGGGYGGNGGKGQNNLTGGGAYGSYTQPTDLGSGGGVRGDPKQEYGGGAIKLTVGDEAIINGIITANGGNGKKNYTRASGGGSGGSIWITAGILKGSGTIRANGGFGENDWTDGGGGSGGRIALYYNDDQSTLAALTAGGGTASLEGNTQHGGAGTIYKKDDSATHGDLIVSNNGTSWPTDRTRIPETPLPNNLNLDNLHVTKFAKVQYQNTLTVTNTAQVSYNGYLDITGTANFETLNINNTGLYYSNGTSSLGTLNVNNGGYYYSQTGSTTSYNTIQWTSQGTIVDNGGSLSLLTAGSLTIPAGAILQGNTPRTFSNVTVNGTLTHTENGTQPVYKINYTITGDLTVDVSGSINVDSKGYAPGAGDGKGTNTDQGAGGAGYGGNGGQGQNRHAGGGAYGNYLQPSDLGSGGGIREGYSAGTGYGGGAVKLTVGDEAIINGTITANGGLGDNSHDRQAGGGSGGSIWIEAGTLDGNGTIRANGGNGGNWSSDGGGGSGGRIALYYTNDDSNLTTLSANGGTSSHEGNTQYGGAGTIYKKPSSANGDLIISNNGSGWSADIIQRISLTPLSSNLSLDNLYITKFAKVTYSGTANISTVNINTNGMFYLSSGSTINHSAINWGDATIIDNGGSMTMLSVGSDLVIPVGATLYGNTQRTLANVTVNGTLTHSENGTEPLNRLDYTITQDLTISASGIIDVTGKGYAPGEGPGAGIDHDCGAGGGAYGGRGGKGRDNSAGGVTYGSSSQPTDLGSGGGLRPGYSAGGYGAGAVKLTVAGTTTINGSVIADGGYASNGTDRTPGGGSGGSIWITTGTLTGNGTVRANGGNSQDWGCDGGGGSGGRIALYYSTDNSNFATLSTNGGTSGLDNNAQYGGAGTIYKKPSSANGDLIISNNNTSWATNPTKIPLTPLPNNLILDNLYVTKSAKAESSGTANISTVNINDTGIFYLASGTSVTHSTINWIGGTIVDNGGSMTLLATGSDLVIPAGVMLQGNAPRTFNSITVNGTLTHSENGTEPLNRLDYTVTQNLTVSAQGSINVTGKGYAPGEGPGKGATSGSDNNSAGGGAYGGRGGLSQHNYVGGIEYGSYSQPTDLGSGGGLRRNYNANTGAGGGAIKLSVGGTVTVNGNITANGGYGDNGSDITPGGGAGGSIWITAGTLVGTGEIKANGGNSRDWNWDGGGGGGGRIALYYDTDNSNLTTLSASGGTSGLGGDAQYGGAGTIYKKGSTNNGDLTVSNNATDWAVDIIKKIPITTLPNNLNLDSLNIIKFAKAASSGTENISTININTSSIFYLSSGSTVTHSTINWVGGTIVDNGGNMTLLTAGSNLVIPAGATLHGNTSRTFANVTVNGTLTHTENGTEPVNKLDYTITQNLMVSASGSINVTSKGYAPGEGPGQGTDTDRGAGGGGYGGAGGKGQENHAGGTTYGSNTQPAELGSGGGVRSGYNANTGYGGGAVKLTVTGTTTINGSVLANGGYGDNGNDRTPGGGSGGSIWIITGTLTGDGTVRANGGDSRDWNYDGGGGGGGRIALYYSTNTSNFAALTVNGGTRGGGGSSQPGEVGTIFHGGIPSTPTNMIQFKSDGVSGIAQGGNTNENTMKIKYQMVHPNPTATLTPQVEFVPLGTTFTNVATNIGEPVAYTGSPVTGEVEITGLADGSSYHWQARVCDASSFCSSWISYGNNTESEADVIVIMNSAPNSPTIPESSFYINAQYTNNLRPTLGFVLTDPNMVDSIGFQIQVSQDNEFEETIISYTSIMGAQGTQSFTVGQEEGEGTYEEGEYNQQLTTGGYYWRVKAIDDKGSGSNWTVATGTPSFRIDLSKPTNASEVIMKSYAGATAEYTNEDDDIWFRRNDLFFSWTEGDDTEGVKGYCLYLGSDPDGNPAEDKGLLGSSPVSISGTTCEFITDGTSINFANSALRSYEWLTSSDEKYYFKVKTIDIANNTYEGPDDDNFISFNFDNTPPQNVTAVSTPSLAFSSPAEMFFSWTMGGAGASDEHSQVLGFQYAVNTRDSWWGNNTDDFTGVVYSPMDRQQPLYLPEEVHNLIHLGQNTVYFRVIDRAGNYSELRTAILNFGGGAPSFLQGSEITVTPEDNTINSFAFSWPEAQASEGNEIDTYYYMINTPVPTSLSTITSNSSTYIATTETEIEESVLPGLRKGSNTISVAVVDRAGNYSSSNVLSATFNLYSDLPDAPSDVTVADISIKDVSIWRAAVVWNEPEYKGTGTLTYHVYRSEDGEDWTKVSTTTGLTYVDTVKESRAYFWRVSATDNSDESKDSPSMSNGVSLTPRGKYTQPPALTSGPASSSISTTKATISWTTNRTGDSKVAFGLGSRNYFESESYNSSQTTEHKIVLNNLAPGTEYYYIAKWTDEDGNTGESPELTFTTEPAPEVKEVRISNRGVNSTLLNFTTVKASSVRVYYGTSTSFGGVKEIGTSKLETSYALQLDKLNDGTKYYFKINTLDEEGKEYEGTILDFETLPRPRVYNIKVQQVAKTAQSTLLITWDSNTEISSVVTYYPSSNANLMRDSIDLELVKGSHEMLIKGLFPDTEYSIRVRGNDIIGNEAVSDVITVKTSRDSRPPQISAMTLEGTNIRLADGGTSSQLIVSWNTDEPSTSQVEYGEGSGDSYNQLTQKDNDLSYNHVVIISGLTPSKVYHLRAISQDSAGNETKSIDTVTITPKATDNALYLVITTLKEAFGFIDNF